MVRLPFRATEDYCLNSLDTYALISIEQIGLFNLAIPQRSLMAFLESEVGHKSIVGDETTIHIKWVEMTDSKYFSLPEWED